MAHVPHPKDKENHAEYSKNKEKYLTEKGVILESESKPKKKPLTSN